MSSVFWNISMDRATEKRFEEHRKNYEKQTGKPITKAAFGRMIFEFWEKANEHYEEKIKHHKKKMEVHLGEAEKHEEELQMLQKMMLTG